MNQKSHAIVDLLRGVHFEVEGDCYLGAGHIT